MITLTLTTEGDTHVVVTRRFAATPEAVYRAHTESTLVQQWMLGPEGWTMPVWCCEARVGGQIRYEWSNGNGREFYLTGEFLELEPFRRIVHVERMHMLDRTKCAISEVIGRNRRRALERWNDEQLRADRGICAREIAEVVVLANERPDTNTVDLDHEQRPFARWGSLRQAVALRHCKCVYTHAHIYFGRHRGASERRTRTTTPARSGRISATTTGTGTATVSAFDLP